MPFYKCTVTHSTGETVQQLEAETAEEAENVVRADLSPRFGDLDITTEEMKEN